MKNKILVLIIVLAAALISCQNDWDGHYKGQQEGTAEGSPEKLGDFLSLEERYSAFTDFLKESGVLDTLNANQILTVWAVDNKNMPTPEELGQWSNKEKKQIALNMLNYMPIYYPKFENGKKIQTLAGKNIFMGINTDGFMLDGIDIVSTNQVCSNGVIHEIAGLIVPRKNLYEYIESLPDNYSMLRDSLLARNDTIFDTERSFPIGVDPTGNTIYDSVFVIHNNFIGSIRDEESKSTVMLPDNRVIQEAFEEMRNYLLADTLSTELKEEMNDWWLKALIYPGELSVYDKDKSIYSIYNKHWRTDIQEVNRAEAVPVSNGLIYPVTKFVFPKSSLLKDVEYIIPDLWQRATGTERETYFAYGGERLYHDFVRNHLRRCTAQQKSLGKRRFEHLVAGSFFTQNGDRHRVCRIYHFGKGHEKQSDPHVTISGDLRCVCMAPFLCSRSGYNFGDFGCGGRYPAPAGRKI